MKINKKCNDTEIVAHFAAFYFFFNFYFFHRLNKRQRFITSLVSNLVVNFSNLLEQMSYMRTEITVKHIEK